MFTGIVQALGQLVSVKPGPKDRELVVASPELADRLFLGASVALDGVCQTVTQLEGDLFTVHAISETLRVTTLGQRQQGDRLNLELPVGAGEPMGGHFVQGHVDGVVHLREISPLGESIRWRMDADKELVEQLVPKGSVALDGVSLTVGPRLETGSFEVYLIPHTLEVTTFGSKRPGSQLNIETDILGKYLLRYLRRDQKTGAGGMSWDTLRRAGFAGEEP